MKKLFVLLLVLSCLFTVFAADTVEVDLEDVIHGFSYFVGAQDFVSNSNYYMGLDANYYAQGAVDVANGEFALSDEQIQYYVNAFGQYYNALMEQENKKLQENLDAANEFLAANKSKKGVTTTASGLQYKINKKGAGKKATSGSNVAVYYTLSLLDGTVVDKHTAADGDPMVFKADPSEVIKGFAEACTVAPAGSTLTAWISPSLGYGEAGAGDSVPGNSLLIFDIQIVSVN